MALRDMAVNKVYNRRWDYIITNKILIIFVETIVLRQISKLIYNKKGALTHGAAAEEYNEESHPDSSNSNDPGETKEQDDTKDILHRRQIYPHDRTEVSFLLLLGLSSLSLGHVGGGGVHGTEGREEGSNTGPRLKLILEGGEAIKFNIIIKPWKSMGMGI